MSGGDFHRAAIDALGGRYGEGRRLVQTRRHDRYGDELARFIYGCHASAMASLHRLGVACALSDVKDVAQLHILEEGGHLTPLDGGAPVSPKAEREAPRATAFDLVFAIGCSEATLHARMRGRAARAGEYSSDKERVRKYMGQASVRQDELKSYTSARQLTGVRMVDGERGVGEICDEIESAIVRGGARKGRPRRCGCAGRRVGRVGRVGRGERRAARRRRSSGGPGPRPHPIGHR